MKATVTVSPANRAKLQTAIDRLLAGTVKPADGKLTWKNVAAIAGVSKATADRAVDLRTEFRRQLQQRTPPPAQHPTASTPTRSDRDQELARLRRENAELKQATNTLHAVILALTYENDKLTLDLPRFR